MNEINYSYTALVIAVIVAITFLTRALPFILFSGRGEPPAAVMYLGKVLPPAVMAMLVVYCLKDTGFLIYPYGVPELIACVFVVVIHTLKRNNLLSIFGGTALYMILVQCVFK